MQQDVIMGCIDDPDISIRLQALDLGAGMVNGDNLTAVVERLMQQLRNAPVSTKIADDGRTYATGVEPAADSDGEDPEETLRPTPEPQSAKPALPSEYRSTIIHRILEMCSQDSYAKIVDFEWYIDVLVQLVKLLPVAAPPSSEQQNGQATSPQSDAATAIGWQLRNVAVRVSTVRTEAVMAASSLVTTSSSGTSSVAVDGGRQGVLPFAAWVVGEYFVSAGLSYNALDSLIHPTTHSLSPEAICSYLQAIPKVLSAAVSHELSEWTLERKTMIKLLVARIIHFLEPLTRHPNLEVQERSVEFLELMRIASQAITSHGLENDDGPLLLTRAIPQLFWGSELNPVAPTAQRKVPIPPGLSLDASINSDLAGLLHRAQQDFSLEAESAEFESFYNDRPSHNTHGGPALDSLPSIQVDSSFYQQTDVSAIEADSLLRKRIERRERNRDDPFYIAGDGHSSGTSTPFHDILKSTNGEDVNLDSIPIMNLDLSNLSATADSSEVELKKLKRKRPKKVHVAKDENLEIEDSGADRPTLGTSFEDRAPSQRLREKAKKSLLQVDSSGLSSLSLNDGEGGKLAIETQEAQDTEMAKALAEVERLRLEMQRASERVQVADGAPAEGTLVKKKKRRKSKPAVGEESAVKESDQGEQGHGTIAVIKKKKKKRKQIIAIADDEKETEAD